jgi:hypothetical protein
MCSVGRRGRPIPGPLQAAQRSQKVSFRNTSIWQSNCLAEIKRFVTGGWVTVVCWNYKGSCKCLRHGTGINGADIFVLVILFYYLWWRAQGGVAAGLQLPTQTPQNRNLKNTDFVDIVVSKVFRDLPFSRNQSLK